MKDKPVYHVVDFIDDCVYSVNIPTLEQAKEIADHGHKTAYPNGGLSIVQNDDLTPNMINQIAKAMSSYSDTKNLG